MVNHSLDQSALATLQQIFPVAGMLHIGSGTGLSIEMTGLTQSPCALLIEADPDVQERLAGKFAANTAWQTLHRVIGANTGTATYFHANNPGESGLVRPDTLRPIWQNLAVREEQECQTQSLQDLLLEDDLGQLTSSINWVIVDCFPSLQILRGAGEFPENWDVIMARVVLDGSVLPNHPELCQNDLDEFLSARGFHPVGVLPERTPSIGLAYYIRQWKSDYLSARDNLQKSIDQQNEKALAAEKTAAEKIAELENQRQSAEKAAAEKIAELENQRQSAEKTAAEKIAELENQHQSAEKTAAEKIAELENQHQSAEKTAAEKIAELTRTRDEAASEIQQLKDRCSGLAREKEDLHTRLQEAQANLAQKSKAGNTLANDLEQSRQETKALQSALSEKEAVLQSHTDTIASLTRKAAAQDKAISEHQASNQASAQQAKALTDTVKAHEKEIADLTAVRDQKNEDLRNKNQIIAQRNQDVQDCKEELSQCNLQLKKQEAARKRDEKLIQLRLNDLNELREKYSALHEQHEEQQAALSKIQNNLKTAVEMAQKPVAKGGGAKSPKPDSKKA